MNILRKLFGGTKQSAPELSAATSNAEEKLKLSHEAIVEARSGIIPVAKMLERLVSGNAFVPLAEPPKMDEQGAVKSWKPATLSKSDGSQWLVAFTDPALASAFARQTPGYSYGLSIEVSWLLRAIPPNHGLVFNVSSDSAFEWNADGLSRYKHDVLGWGAA